MTEQEFRIEFNKMLGKVMTLIEVSNNYALKREVKGAMFDFSDVVIEREFNEKENQNESTESINNIR